MDDRSLASSPHPTPSVSSFHLSPAARCPAPLWPLILISQLPVRLRCDNKRTHHAADGEHALNRGGTPKKDLVIHPWVGCERTSSVETPGDTRSRSQASLDVLPSTNKSYSYSSEVKHLCFFAQSDAHLSDCRYSIYYA